MLFYSSCQTNQIRPFGFWENLRRTTLLFDFISPLVKSQENGNSSQYPLINYIDLEDENEEEDEGVEEEDDEEGDDSCFGDDVFNSLAGLYNIILRIARNLLVTRENIKFLTHPFYPMNLD